ncbi:MAG: DUF928 domain-containing protein [Phormidesmis sp. CAN_BIN44]|nr:DUF928 domain-containing protein [Phormidesmis sp. CAN_BIN44]
MAAIKTHKLWLKVTAAIVALGLLTSTLSASAVSFNWKSLRRNGSPVRRASAGTRGPAFCVTGKKPLVSLTPSQYNSQTGSDSPTLYAYVPHTIAKQAKVLWVEKGTEASAKRSERTYQLSGKSGIVGFKLPAGAIAAGKEYRWTLVLLCYPQNYGSNDRVESFIQRAPVGADIAQALKSATTLQQRLDLYSQAGLWQDGLAEIAQRRQNRPNDSDLKKAWDSWLLLDEVRLDKVEVGPKSFIGIVDEPVLSPSDSPKLLP